MLHSYHQGFKWTDDISAGISEVMQTWPAGVELIHEYMDSKRRWDKNYKMLLEGLLSYKYRNMQPDAVIVSDNLAFDYMCESGKDVFPGFGFCGVNYLDPQVLRGLPNFTGISEVADIDRNIELIIKLQLNFQKSFLSLIIPRLARFWLLTSMAVGRNIRKSKSDSLLM